MKRVLLCVNSDLARSNTIGFRFTKIAEVLQKKNISFDIIARANYSTNLKATTPIFKNFLGRFLNAVHLYLTPGISYRFIDVFIFDLYVLLKLKLGSKNYQIAHFGEYAHRSIRYLKKKGTKVYLDVPIGHYAYDKFLLDLGIKSDKQYFDPCKFIDKAMMVADFLIIPSKFVANTLTIAKINTPVIIIPFGANSVHAIKAKDTPQNRPFTFMFAGSVSMRKGIIYLLEAWNALRQQNAQLIICGRIYKEIHSEIKAANTKNIVFTGFANLNEYFNKADVFVFPTVFEGSAKVVYEAMAHSLPVITTDNAGSVVLDGEEGFIVPIGNFEALAQKMRYFYDHPEQAKLMGAKAYQKSKLYTWDKYGQSVVNSYLL